MKFKVGDKINQKGSSEIFDVSIVKTDGTVVATLISSVGEEGPEHILAPETLKKYGFHKLTRDQQVKAISRMMIEAFKSGAMRFERKK